MDEENLCRFKHWAIGTRLSNLWDYITLGSASDGSSGNASGKQWLLTSDLKCHGKWDKHEREQDVQRRWGTKRKPVWRWVSRWDAKPRERLGKEGGWGCTVWQRTVGSTVGFYPMWNFQADFTKTKFWKITWLLERVRKRTTVPSLSWFTPQMLTITRAKPNGSQDTGTLELPCG